MFHLTEALHDQPWGSTNKESVLWLATILVFCSIIIYQFVSTFTPPSRKWSVHWFWIDKSGLWRIIVLHVFLKHREIKEKDDVVKDKSCFVLLTVWKFHPVFIINRNHRKVFQILMSAFLFMAYPACFLLFVFLRVSFRRWSCWRQCRKVFEARKGYFCHALFKFRTDKRTG